MTIEKLRKEIDILDEQIMNLLLKRVEIVQQVGKLKHEQTIPVLDQNREQIIFKKIRDINASQQDKEIINKVYQTILMTSKELQINNSK